METIETVVIGGGQAGLAVGYHLKRRGRPFLILDAGARTGDAWRQRWDSLRLFSPAHMDGLDGMPFPGAPGEFPTKDQMADYLEAYAARFELPVRHGFRVDRLSRLGDQFEIASGQRRLLASNVVVAMSSLQAPRVPAFAAELSPEIRQLHSQDYRNPSQLREGAVLIVGVGNSGADIALEVAGTHRTYVAGRVGAVVPWRIDTFFGRHLGSRLFRLVAHHLLTVRTPMGRRARSGTAPLVRVKPRDIVEAGATRLARIVGARGGLPVTEGGEVLDVRNVIWCTGYRPGFAWIDLPVLGDGQEPEHELGLVPSQPGLYFVGLHFLYSLSSETVAGVCRDARRIAGRIAARQAQAAQARDGVPAEAAS